MAERYKFTPETARAGGKKSRPGEHFATKFRKQFGEDATPVRIFVEASKRIYSHLTNPALETAKGQTFLSEEQLNEINALQKFVLKGIDKVVPTLSESDVNVTNDQNVYVFVMPEVTDDPLAHLAIPGEDDARLN